MKSIKYIILEQIISEGRLEDIIKKYGDIDQNTIRELSQNDPSGNNKYLEWMVKSIIDSPNAGDEIIKMVNCFHKNLNRLNDKTITDMYGKNTSQDVELDRIIKSPKDINSYKSYHWIVPICEYFQENTPKNEERIKLWENGKWMVIVPLTHKASCKYGIHSNWCVSTSNPQFWDRYTQDGVLIFWLDKQQLHPTRGEEVGKYKIAVNIKFNSYYEPSLWDWYSMSDERLDAEFMLTVLPQEGIEACRNYVQSLIEPKLNEVKKIIESFMPYSEGIVYEYNNAYIIPKNVNGKIDKTIANKFKSSGYFDGDINVVLINDSKEGGITYIRINIMSGLDKDGELDGWPSSVYLHELLGLVDVNGIIKKSAVIKLINEELPIDQLDESVKSSIVDGFIRRFNAQDENDRVSRVSTPANELKVGDEIESVGGFSKVIKLSDRTIWLSNGKKKVRSHTNWLTRINRGIQIIDDTVNESRWIRKRII